MDTKLTVDSIKTEAAKFSKSISRRRIRSLYGVTDGKAIGTFIEHAFKKYLVKNYKFKIGSSAKGIDFPEYGIDVKVTSIKQPQSSCPFRTARQKIYGLGYSILLFVYNKVDVSNEHIARVNILYTIYIDAPYTADYQITRQILEICKKDGNEDDLVALFEDRNLPVDEIEALKIAKNILRKPPKQGFLTISNALQWRLQYKRIIDIAGSRRGIEKLWR